MIGSAFRLLPLFVLACLTACQGVPAQHRTAAPPPTEGALQVGFVVVEGVYGSELVAPHDIFQHTIFHTQPGMEVFTVSPSKEPLRTFEGLWLLPDYEFADAPPIDVLVVPSAEHNMDSDLENEALIRFVRERGQSARWVMSLCDGAFVLAKAGLLDGLEVTTFPSDRERLAEMFPGLEVRFDVEFVHDGKAITSVGGALSYNPALYLCERLWGAATTQGIAKGLVLDWDLTALTHQVAPGAQ